jgi:hypothetical protein
MNSAEITQMRMSEGFGDLFRKNTKKDAELPPQFDPLNVMEPATTEDNYHRCSYCVM